MVQFLQQMLIQKPCKSWFENLNKMFLFTRTTTMPHFVNFSTTYHDWTTKFLSFLMNFSFLDVWKFKVVLWCWKELWEVPKIKIFKDCDQKLTKVSKILVRVSSPLIFLKLLSSTIVINRNCYFQRINPPKIYPNLQPY